MLKKLKCFLGFHYGEYEYLDMHYPYNVLQRYCSKCDYHQIILERIDEE